MPTISSNSLLSMNSSNVVIFILLYDDELRLELIAKLNIRPYHFYILTN